MSTYIYLECLDHTPPLKSHDEVGQHLSDLPQIRKDIANRDAFVALAADSYLLPDYGHHFRNNTAWFLCQHPQCRIGIRDEYGQEHDINE